MRTGAECWFFEAVAALSLFLGRLSVPESQAWLAAVRRGGVRTAGVRIQDNRADWLRLLAAPENRFGFFFSSGFWLCQTIPATIMMFYSPAILGSLSAGGDAVAQMLLLYGFFVAGILPSGAKYFADRPRSVLLGTFLAMLAGLTGVVLFAESSPTATNAAFILFAAAYGLQAPLDFVYPNRLFATEVRTTLVGAVTAVSRIGAAAAAFVFPLLAERMASSTLLGCAIAILALGGGLDRAPLGARLMRLPSAFTAWRPCRLTGPQPFGRTPRPAARA